MDNTWIKFYRKSKDNEIMKDHLAWTLFSWILLSVDRKTGKYNTGRFLLAEALDAKPPTIQKALARLSEKYKMVSLNSNNRFTEISVLNWAKYQGGEDEVSAPVSSKYQQSITPIYNKKKRSREERECSISLIPCNTLCLWEIGMKLDTHMKNVAEKSQDLQDYIEDHPRKYKTFHKTLINWVKADLRRGYISYLSETERLEMNVEHPDKQAERKRLHEQAVKEGIL